MSFTTRTAVLREAPGRYETVTLDLDEPRQNEVTVKMVAAGLCLSLIHI